LNEKLLLIENHLLIKDLNIEVMMDKLNLKKQSVQCLLNSKYLKKLFHAILSYSNVLNNGLMNYENLNCFKFDTLNILKNMKSNDKNLTFLDFILLYNFENFEIIQLYNELNNFYTYFNFEVDPVYLVSLFDNYFDLLNKNMDKNLENNLLFIQFDNLKFIFNELISLENSLFSYFLIDFNHDTFLFVFNNFYLDFICSFKKLNLSF
jgi:hypothetical protein